MPSAQGPRHTNTITGKKSGPVFLFYISHIQFHRVACFYMLHNFFYSCFREPTTIFLWQLNQETLMHMLIWEK